MADFNYVELQAPKESGFDLSYTNKFTCDFGDLVPCLVQECLPGDEFQLKENYMVRMAPLANPIFTKVDAQVHYFFVPNRILWDGPTKFDNWETFITGGPNGDKTPTPPHATALNMYNDAVIQTRAQSLCDYLGMPIKTQERAQILESAESDGYMSPYVNLLPFMAYQKIYDDWYRDPNLTESIYDTYSVDDISSLTHGGTYNDTQALSVLTTMRKRAFAKDYFTSALPWSQRGEDVHIPSGTISGKIRNAGGTDDTYVLHDEKVAITPTGGDTTALGATIRDLRNASRLQLWLEKNALGGGRYIEQMLSHFGTYSDDARLQRAEYLGSVKSPVVISEIQGTATTDKSELGELAGKGTSYANDFAFDYKCKEHGWIIGIFSVLPELSYSQGLPRYLMNRNEKLDYAFPEFAEIGMQEVDNGEVNMVATINRDEYGTGDNVFGYQERYMEYKCNINQIHGKFADPDDTLSQFNITRFYDDDEAVDLNANFVECYEGNLQSPFVNTATNSGNLWVDMFHDFKAIRPLPKTTIPLIY